jgi:hypothetical protein
MPSQPGQGMHAGMHAAHRKAIMCGTCLAHCCPDDAASMLGSLLPRCCCPALLRGSCCQCLLDLVHINPPLGTHSSSSRDDLLRSSLRAQSCTRLGGQPGRQHVASPSATRPAMHHDLQATASQAISQSSHQASKRERHGALFLSGLSSAAIWAASKESHWCPSQVNIMTSALISLHVAVRPDITTCCRAP